MKFAPHTVVNAPAERVDLEDWVWRLAIVESSMEVSLGGGPMWDSARMRSAMWGWCSSKAGRSERIGGSSVKLCRGGGQLVAHSSELPWPHGSSTVTGSP